MTIFGVPVSRSAVRCSPAAASSRVVFLDGALLTGAERKHAHIRQCPDGIAFIDIEFDDRDPPAGCHRLPAAPKDDDGLVVAPVMQNEFQQVEVPAGNGLKEVPTDHVCAVREAGSDDLRPGVFDHVG